MRVWGELCSCWWVPAIAHFCFLFRTAFCLPDFSKELVNISLPENMMLQPNTEAEIREHRLNGDPTALIKEKQAINSDYEGSGYDKGHLNPNAHHPDGPTQRATYTLTNVAPMNPTLNRGEWRAYEEHLRQMADNCITVYVVTGVVPGNTWIMEGGQRRVNIPSHIWSGYCCLDYSNKLISLGALTPNRENALEHMSIDNLQTELTRLLGTTITLFHNNCS